MLIASCAPRACSFLLRIFNIFHVLPLHFVQFMVQSQLKQQISVLIIISSRSFVSFLSPMPHSDITCNLSAADIHYPGKHVLLVVVEITLRLFLSHGVTCSLAHRDVWNWSCYCLFSTTQNKKTPPTPQPCSEFRCLR